MTHFSAKSWRLLGLAALIGASYGMAQARESAVVQAPAQEFTFKKIAPPAPGTTRRITVQIVPVAPPPPPVLPAPADQPPQPARPDEEPVVQAFWSATGTELRAASPARFLAAAEFMQGTVGSAHPAPSLRVLQSLAAAHGRKILASTIGTRVSPALVLSVMSVESSGRPDAVSPKGAQGLMQLIPATAARFDVDDPFDPAESIAGAVRYLDWLLDTFEGDAVLALAGYNAGENAVKGAGGVPDYPETRAYVPKVLAAWRVARSLCATPPELASDGCVFTTMAAN